MFDDTSKNSKHPENERKVQYKMRLILYILFLYLIHGRVDSANIRK